MNAPIQSSHPAAGLPRVDKTNPAITIDPDGTTRRTIWGYFLPEDVATIAAAYPEIGADVIHEIAVAVTPDQKTEMIPAPRLLEVLVPLELVTRYLRGEFSRIRRGIPEALKLVANPLSILSFFSIDGEGEVWRVVTKETELMHKPAEKLALRTGALDRLNALFAQRFGGLQLAYGCSCCALVFHEDDRDAVLGSEYYGKREQQGRWWDSDVLTAQGRLVGPMPITDVPPAFFEGSVDFGAPEVASYKRFAGLAQACLDNHPGDNVVDLSKWSKRAACFIGGQCPCANGACKGSANEPVAAAV